MSGITYDPASHYDRVTDANGEPANYVVIDHGNGWSTDYFHLREGTSETLALTARAIHEALTHAAGPVLLAALVGRQNP